MENLLLIGGLIYIARELGLNKEKDTKKDNNVFTTEKAKFNFANDMNNHLNQSNVYSESNKHPSQIPYYRSEKSQNTNDDYKNRKLQTMTGIGQVDYKNKKEKEINFNENLKGLTEINGTQNKNELFYKYYKPSTYHNNTHPNQPENVGRGLGLPTEQAAGGGFHQNFRILPDNINSYKKNNYAGTLIVGKSAIDNSTTPVSNVTQYKLNNEYNHKFRPFEKGKASVNATTCYSDYTHDYNMTNREHCNSSNFVNGTRSGSKLGINETRKDDRTCQFFRETGNPSKESINMGYNNSQYLFNDTQREQCSDNNINVNQQGLGSVVTETYSINPTLRDTDSLQAFNVGPISGPEGHKVFNGEVKSTNRNTTECSDYFGNLNGTKSGNFTMISRDLQSTMRGNNNTYNNGIGPAGGVLSGQTNYSSAYKGTQEYAVKDLTLTGFTPHMSRVNVPLNAQDTMNNSWHKIDTNENKIMSNPQWKGINTHSNVSEIGNVLIPKKLPEENNRDLNIAKCQLKSNEYAIDISK